MKLAKKLFSLLLVIAIAAALVIPASAASFSGGKGTSSNPYIITTAEQLNAMRDNLSAHYKLGANIDLKGVSWKAVGTWKKAFTGSLTCDVDSTGKPIYAISNLTCTVAPVQPDGKKYDDPHYRYGDYKEDGSSGWEAGLFGVCNKATISNIILLNVKVTNYAQGRSQQSNYTPEGATESQVVNNPVYQMCAGGLAGALLSSKVTGCGVTGLVTGKSNNMGGFAGTIAGSSVVKQCYAIVDVKGGGEWFTGGFVGATDVNKVEKKLIPFTGDPTISECYAEGYVAGSWCNTGGFIGGITMVSGARTVKITDCMNRGTTNDPSSGRSFFGQDPKNTTKGSEALMSNCITLAGLDGKGKASTAKGKADCFVGVEADSSGNYPYQNGFTAADKATINSKFKSNPAWTVKDGSYPELKNVHIIKSLSDLGKAEEVKETTPEETTGGGNSSGGTSGGNSSENPDATTPSGEVDATEGTRGEGDIDINTTIYDNTAQMGTFELILVIVLLALFGITLIGNIVTIILTIRHLKRNKK